MNSLQHFFSVFFTDILCISSERQPCHHFAILPVSSAAGVSILTSTSVFCSIPTVGCNQGCSQCNSTTLGFIWKQTEAVVFVLHSSVITAFLLYLTKLHLFIPSYRFTLFLHPIRILSLVFEPLYAVNVNVSLSRLKPHSRVYGWLILIMCLN